MNRPPRDHRGVTVLMDRVAAVAPSVDEACVAGWDAAFDDMFAQVVAPVFSRREPRLRARPYLRGLVSGLERKNGWTLAEFAGDAAPDGMQRLLNAARWDAVTTASHPPPSGIAAAGPVTATPRERGSLPARPGMAVTTRPPTATNR